ncbi:AAA family ATPase [Chloroflexota bacterium]
MVSEPSLVHNAGIYVFKFTEEALNIRVDRITEKSSNTSGEITILTEAPGINPFIHQARLNLTSTTARNALAKYLNTRFELDDWAGILEIVCAMVLRKHREGEPVQTVGNLPARDSSKYRLSPLLVESEPNIFFGPGGVGKSYLACYISVLVQTGTDHHALHPVQGNVLYLDWETSRYEIDERIKAVSRGMSLEGITIKHRFCSQSLASDITRIQRMVVDTEAALVIVDSVGSACGGEPESAEVVLRYFMALRSLKATTLSIDHVAKSGDSKTPFGSVFKINAASLTSTAGT